MTGTVAGLVTGDAITGAGFAPGITVDAPSAEALSV